jgi:hypothetical protein
VRSYKELWVGLYEDTLGQRSCEEFWVPSDEAEPWDRIEEAIGSGKTLIAVIPGRRPKRMRWAARDLRVRSDQQRIDIWSGTDLQQP